MLSLGLVSNEDRYSLEVADRELFSLNKRIVHVGVSLTSTAAVATSGYFSSLILEESKSIEYYKPLAPLTFVVTFVAVLVGIAAIYKARVGNIATIACLLIAAVFKGISKDGLDMASGLFGFIALLTGYAILLLGSAFLGLSAFFADRV